MAPGDEGTRADAPHRSVAKAVRPRRLGIVLSRSAQGTRSELLSTQWSLSAWWHGAAGANLGCCVSGECCSSAKGRWEG